MANEPPQGESTSETSSPPDEAMYRTLFDALDTALFLMRGPACVVCNPAGARLFGVGHRDELVGKTPLDFAPTYQPSGVASVEMVQDNFVQARALGTHAFEWLTAKADGTPIVIEVRFTMLPGTDELYLCAATDISERKQAEQALRESEERFRTLFESSGEGILIADAASRRFRFANPAMCELLGYEREELERLAVTDIHPPDALAEVEAAFERYVHRSEPKLFETSCVRKDGSEIPVSVRSGRLVVAGEQLAAGFFTDESSRRQLEEERLKAQKLEAVGRLAGGIAHDFNNMLQGVFGFISLARIAQGDRERGLAMLDLAEKALRQAVHLTNQLLAFSKGGQPSKTTLELGPLIASAVTFALSGSRADSHVLVEADLRPVDADAGQLTQVIQNIVLNAAQAMPLGGTVHVSARNLAASVDELPAQLPAGRFVAIAVRDTGVGIPAQYLPKIFDPYFTTKDKGSGLGLATSYAIVRNHRGLIDVASSVGEGSTFTIYLPAARDAVDAPVLEDQAEPLRFRPARLLLMDDDPMVLETTAALLRGLGHNVDMAEHGAAAVELYQRALAASSPHDLIILDLTVRGGMGGLEAARQLRLLDPAVRVVITSGYSDELAAVEAGDRVWLGFLKKPFDLETLRTTLDPLLPRES